MYKAFLFDLDGTLTESGEGIIRSVQYALIRMGRPCPPPEAVRCFIGPPLLSQFMSFAGMSEEEAGEAVRLYRERFGVIVLWENRLYPGIESLLQRLSRTGVRLAVTSSKPDPYVQRICAHFGLSVFFDPIVGASMDEKKAGKAIVVGETLRRLGLEQDPESALMIGDTAHDVLGARACGVPCAAVSYGYGNETELLAARPRYFVHTVSELSDLLARLAEARES